MSSPVSLIADHYYWIPDSARASTLGGIVRPIGWLFQFDYAFKRSWLLNRQVSWVARVL
jgi:hypothetical protein